MPNDQPQEFTRPPKKSLTPWVLVLPIVLFVGVIWQLQSGTNLPSPIETFEDGSNSSTAPKVGSKPNPIKKPGVTVFVPDDQAILQPKAVPQPTPKPGAAAYEKQAEKALQVQFQSAPILFPATTKLTQPLKRDGDVVVVSLNKPFQEYVESKGDKTIELALNAMARTLASVEAPEKPAKMRLLIEGKPVDVLGEFVVEDTDLSATPSLAANH